MRDVKKNQFYRKYRPQIDLQDVLGAVKHTIYSNCKFK